MDNEAEFYLQGESENPHFYEGSTRSSLTSSSSSSSTTRGASSSMGTSATATSSSSTSFRSAMKSKNQNAWEDTILRRTQDGTGGNHNNNQDDDDFTREQILVKSTTPSFLRDMAALISKRTDTVDVVRDRASDLARAAENGSAVVRQWREKKATNSMRQKYWELGGTQMGQTLGMKEEAKYTDGRVEANGDVAVGSVDGDKPPSSQAEAVVTPVSARRNVELPIDRVLPDLLKAIRDNPVVVVVGETGSGKTTRLPIALWRENLKLRRGGGIVGCTQPRRVAAMSVARRVAEEFGTPIGQEVGYSIRFEDVTSDKTRVKYLTDGILLRESLRDPDLEAYSHVVMDEAHERSLNTDVLFGITKRILRSRLDFRLVVTSATLDAERFAAFFGSAAIFHIPGRTFKVDTYYSKFPVADYVDAAVKQILQIHLTLPSPGDILVFMSGEEDVTATCEIAAERLREVLRATADDEETHKEAKTRRSRDKLLILPMYSTLPGEAQSRIFAPTLLGERKCVVSTNIAETSITVEGIKYVVDAGFVKTNVYNPKVGMDTLRLIPVSQAAANQRAGRAGRTQEGFCYRLYTDVQFRSEMLATAVPEIQRTNLANTVLLLKSLGVDDASRFDFMDPPPRELVANALYSLWTLGALDDDGKLTPLGRRMVEFPLEPALSRMLITAQHEDCVDDALTVAAMLSVPDAFFRPKDREQEADNARERFVVPESDHLTLLNLYNQWIRHGKSQGFCLSHFLHHRTLVRAADVRSQIADVVSSSTAALARHSNNATVARRGARAPGESDSEAWDRVRRAVCSAYFPHAAKLKGNGLYTSLLTGLPANLHPSSALFGTGVAPDLVVYHEMLLTSKEYMRQVCAVEAAWLVEFGGAFFELAGRDGANNKSIGGGGGGKHSVSGEDDKVRNSWVMPGTTMSAPAAVPTVVASGVKSGKPSNNYKEGGLSFATGDEDDEDESHVKAARMAREQKKRKLGGGGY